MLARIACKVKKNVDLPVDSLTCKLTALSLETHIGALSILD
jgi:hypothetical protein